MSTSTLTRPQTPDQLAADLSQCLPCQVRQQAAATARHRLATNAATPAGAEPVSGGSPVTWHGVLIQENVMTGDGRFIEPNALRWADLPMPLRWVQEDVGGHDNAVVVGRILTVERATNGDITATGDFDMASEFGREAARQVDQGLQPGVSADVDDLSFEIRIAKELVDGADQAPTVEIEVQAADADGRVTVAEIGANDEVRVLTDGRIRAATLVAIPAFAGARIFLDQPLGDFQNEGTNPAGDPCSCDQAADNYDPDCDCTASTPAQTASAAVFVSERPWSDFTPADYSDAQWTRATILDRGGDGTPKQRYGLPVREPAGALNRNGAHAAAGSLAGARGGINAPADAKRAAANRLITIYNRDLDETPPDSLYRAAGRTPPASNAADLAASAGPLAPPADWFTDPHLTGPTGITVTPDGRIFGHLAVWGSCHTGYPGQCITPPMSNSGYAYFRTGTVLSADGVEIPVGRITMDTMHAAKNLGAADTLSHYEHTGRCVADVAAGDDEYGIWVAGAIRPNLTDEQIRALRSSPLSGDWRRIGGGLELVAALAVNVPGFPVPRPAGLVASGQMQSLVASGMIAPTLYDRQGSLPEALSEQLSEQDARMLRHLLDRESDNVRREAADLAAQVVAGQLAAQVRNL